MSEQLNACVACPLCKGVIQVQPAQLVSASDVDAKDSKINVMVGACTECEFVVTIK